jgi:hypothetical protein
MKIIAGRRNQRLSALVIIPWLFAPRFRRRPHLIFNIHFALTHYEAFV